MLRRTLLRCTYPPTALFSSTPCCATNVQQRYFSGKKPACDALRILFCGADEFSIHSLQALYGLHKERPDKVASLDIVCRPDKRVGRGLKQVKEVPIKTVAKDLQLPLHQIDTFTGWSPPSPIDLIVTVSFGLLVPARILHAAKHGGLNVHPSMLPDLRGPAPIQHALLQAKSHTGITLQTMHPTRFDHGKIISQTPLPGLPIPENATPALLVRELGLVGAEMLRKCIEDNLFLSTHPVVEANNSIEGSHAPKITPAERRIDWETWTADQILRRDRVLGRLWDMTTYEACHAKTPKRVTFGGPWREVPREDLHIREQGMNARLPTLSHIDGPGKPRLAFHTADGKIITPENVTVEGEQKGKAMPSLVQAIKLSCEDLINK